MYLSDYVYERLVDSVSKKERSLLDGIADVGETVETKEIMSFGGFTQNEISVYRSRLMKRGILTSKDRGSISFALPRFREYLINIRKFA